MQVDAIQLRTVHTVGRFIPNKRIIYWWLLLDPEHNRFKNQSYFKYKMSECDNTLYQRILKQNSTTNGKLILNYILVVSIYIKMYYFVMCF